MRRASPRQSRRVSHVTSVSWAIPWHRPQVDFFLNYISLTPRGVDPSTFHLFYVFQASGLKLLLFDPVHRE